MCILLTLTWGRHAQAQTPRLTLTPFLSGLTQPVLLTNAKDGTNRRFIIEQVGRIRVLQPGATVSTLFLDISSRVLYGGERGLLGLAFHPKFSSNRRFYVNYTRQRDGATVVAEYRDGAEQRILFTVPQPYENHNGGMIEFGPDGFLYVGMGDGGAGNDPQNRAQNPNELLGKMLRINVDVPNSAPEIFASGFRNPWRFSFDRLTGQLYAGDVGQSAREEVDIVTQGGNYGWRVWEGTFCTGLGPASCSAAGFIPPIAEYVNTGPDGRCAIIGGYVYRGAQGSLPYGAYIYGDLCSGEIFMLKDGVQTLLLETTLQISSFGEDESGELYVLNLNGSIFRLTNPDAVFASQRPYAIADAPFVASTRRKLRRADPRVCADTAGYRPTGSIGHGDLWSPTTGRTDVRSLRSHFTANLDGTCVRRSELECKHRHCPRKSERSGCNGVVLLYRRQWNETSRRRDDACAATADCSLLDRAPFRCRRSDARLFHVHILRCPSRRSR